MRRRGQFLDQGVTTEQIIFAGEVVDMALMPVDPVHVRAFDLIRRLGHGSHPSLRT